jgi:hypothetical protein
MKMMAQAGCDSEACYDQNGTLTIITALFSEQSGSDYQRIPWSEVAG